MGWPVMHSRSPLMHNYWMRQQGVEGSGVPGPGPVRARGIAPSHPVGRRARELHLVELIEMDLPRLPDRCVELPAGESLAKLDVVLVAEPDEVEEVLFPLPQRGYGALGGSGGQVILAGPLTLSKG